MINVRRSDDRGHADRGWLKSRFTFSFADYMDPEQMGFRSLRVINEDWFAPGMGFPTHPHRDMEIITWVLEGALEHRDTLGTGSKLLPGEAQVMTAGTGIAHSEFNSSEDNWLHLLQIWLLPDRRGHRPTYDQKLFPAEGRTNKLQLIASQGGREGSLTIHQDTAIYACNLSSGESVNHPLETGRHGWIQVTSGELSVNGRSLQAGDGAAVSDEQELALSALSDSNFLLFDLA